LKEKKKTTKHTPVLDHAAHMHAKLSNKLPVWAYFALQTAHSEPAPAAAQSAKHELPNI